MILNLQDPTYKESACLYKTLTKECKNAIRGVGVYAFASKEGIKLLLEDKSFKEFISKGKYILIVGIDDITNIHSINYLIKLQRKYAGHLKVKVYIHNTVGAIFHPKYSWFERKDGGVIILGSGNLTLNGLKRNREAYLVNNLSKEEIINVKKEWKEWYKHSQKFLYDLDSLQVIKAIRN